MTVPTHAAPSTPVARHARRSVFQQLPAIAGAALTLLLLSSCTALGGLADPKRGVNTAKLDAYMASVERDVNAGLAPGAVLLVARDGQIVYTRAVGQQDPETRKPMARDSIFRVYSMTKPVVSVATLSLVEEGRIGLSAPVSLYLPELKGLQVGVERPGSDGKPTLVLEPARREMTVQDLLRHTSGLTYGVFGRSLVKDEYLKANMRPGAPGLDFDNAEMVRRIGKLPLAYQPGSTWEYSISTDVLGALLEKVTGKTLDVVLNERVLKPLRMNDTAFVVPTEKHGRIAEPFKADPDTKQPINLLDVRRTPKLLAGGAGLASTADDFFRFGQMLANGGELDGVRVLARKTVEWMTSDHTDGTRGPTYLPGPGYGFGLGVAVRQANGQSTIPGSAGDFHWGGAAGTLWWADPRERLVAVWMIQAPGRSAYFRATMRTAVYTSLD